jgi:hypothetical protein
MTPTLTPCACGAAPEIGQNYGLEWEVGCHSCADYSYEGPELGDVGGWPHASGKTQEAAIAEWQAMREEELEEAADAT